ncbi:RECEPTOR KINASE-LIKE PROTEIN XA21 [Salix koriyanagi]|uniref:RECEPTOR KINASE-LIKE PROTEIN XA21 n=1 Tax=Salix koriyanagi TaxID=2511006 RepID=A0A9Q1A4V9_9ROSI|nr:RECEPTOR KINASE-LIKE PROTEIN XA21 [Salix koriyanagi]
MSRLPLLLLSILVLVSLPFEVISQNVNAEKTILLNLKQQLGNPSSIQSWKNSSSSPCEWPDVYCVEGTVAGLELGNKNITRTIPASVCDLKNLTYLNLNWNYIPGGFPRVLYSCTRLEKLDLSQNYFVGPIPDDIDRLSSLRYLYLQGNNFTGNIPPQIGNLTELRTLFLHQNQFNGTFPKEIGRLSNLEEMALAYIDFVPSSIPVEFGQLKKLRLLWMKLANLIGEIPESLSNLSSLVHLDLAGNDLEGKIPDGLFLLKNLTNLYLFKNKLSGEIPQTVETLSLVEIDLAMNQLNGSIPEDFGKLKKLQLLNLFENHLSGEVSASIGLLPELRTLKVFTNNLSGFLPPKMGLYSTLEEFDVSTNQFSGQLPENLCAGGVLQGVVASENNLSGEVPQSLGNCNSLRTVRLYSNNFSGEIPAGIWTAFNMTYLMLSDNSFSGGLPSKLAWNLSRCELNNNRFSGPIPHGVSSWVNLVVFEASNNWFSGEIPVEITSTPHLSNLLLDGNQFSGQLPSKILSWRSLTSLNLSRNRLSGQIPKEIGSLPDLLYLDLSQNHFSGEIPPEFGQLKLIFLNLSSNNLSGKIPDQFNNLAYDNSFLKNSKLCAVNPILDFPACYSKLRDSKTLFSKILSLILVLTVTILFVTIIVTLFMVRDCQRRKQKRDLALWKLTSFQRLDFTEANILENLTENNLIGSGGSGKVYRIAINRAGDFVAVKRIWNNEEMDDKLGKEFSAEVQILGTIRHANIVKLLCCISSENSKLLVYEYMENHSLDEWLHGRKRSSSIGESAVHHPVLDWPTRLQIAIGAAQGLCYMHHDCSTPIVHRDVKSSNILLDSDFKPRIADFGLAKMLAKQGDAHTMSSVAGSFGYIAPEPNGGDDEHTSLAEWAWRRFGQGKPIFDSLDREIKKSCFLQEMTTVFDLGLVCTHTLPTTRPSMKDVLEILRRCSPATNGEKKTAFEFDISPLLGDVTCLSSNGRGNR